MPNFFDKFDAPTDPVIAVDPYKQAAEARAQEDQAMQRQAQAQQAERLNIARDAEARAQEKAARDQEVRDKGYDATEGERKAAAFLLRALGANSSYEGTGVGPRSYVGQAMANNTPDLLNVLPSGVGNSPERQVSDSAQDEFIAASLRQDSGAAIPPEELERQRRIYFPMPGDGPEALEQKRQARLRAIEGLKQSSGRLLENTLAEWEQMAQSEAGDATKNVPEEEGLTGTVSYDPSDPNSPPLADPFDGQRQMFGEAGAGLAAAATLGKQGITFGLSDEAAGIGGAISGLLSGDGVKEGYVTARDAERRKIEAAREALGPGGIALEFAGAGGGAVNALSGMGNALRAGRAVAAGGQPVTRGAIQQGMTRAATREGAALGALGGFGYGEGAEGSAVNALIGAGVGGALGNVGQRIGNAATNRARQQSGAETLRAADALGIEPIPAVTGGPATQRLTSGARQGFISDRPVSKAVSRMEEQGKAARDAAAENLEEVLEPEDAGELIRSAANVYSKRTSQIGGRLYERADRIAGGEKLPLPKAVEAADAELAQLAKAPGGEEAALYRDIAKLRDQMRGGSFEVDGIRAFRSRLRNELTAQGLRGSPQDVAFGRILEAAEQDIVSGLQAAGKENAAQALQTAARFWRKRVEAIDEVLEPVLGKNSPKSGEQVLSALERMANPKSGNASRLRRLFESMPEQEANSVRATIINRMGQPTAGAAEKGQGFSFNTFLTQWNNMTPRARAVLFPKETRKALDNLATVSRGVKEAGAALNTSNTAGALVSQGAISGGLWLLDPLTALGAGASQYAIGKLLASPKFARLLAGAPKKDTPQARQAITKRLGNLAKTEPALANEIGLFQRHVAANDNMAGRLAAEDE